MFFLHETTYDVNAGHFEAFQQWLRKNEDVLAESYPEGATYIGTYAAVFGDAGGAAYKTVVQLDSYGGLDAVADEIAKEGRLGRLLWELSAFTVDGASSRGRQELWKRARDKVATSG